MSTFTTYPQRIEQLHSQAASIMLQISAAENGERMEYTRFRALLASKNSVATDTTRIINEINCTLNRAARSLSNRLPYPQYKELREARKNARKIIDLIHAPHAPNQSIPAPTPAPTAVPISDFDWLDDDEDYQLPF